MAIALFLLPIVALANIAVLVWSLGTVTLAERLVAPHLLAFAALLVFVPMFANALRLFLLSQFLGLRLGFGGALRVITGTMVANSVSPSATGGIPIKILFLLNEGVETKRALSLISFQTAEDAITLFGFVALTATISGFALLDFLSSDASFAVALSKSLHIAAIISIALLGALALLGTLIGNGFFGSRARDWTVRRLRSVRRAGAMVTNDWRTLLATGKALALVNLGIAAVQWAVRFSIAGLVVAAFGTDWQPALFWVLQYLVQVISSTVPSPGGVGGAEAGFLLLFSPFVDSKVLLPAMSAWRLLFFYFPLIAAATTFVILRRHRLRKGSPHDRKTPRMPVQAPAE